MNAFSDGASRSLWSRCARNRSATSSGVVRPSRYERVKSSMPGNRNPGGSPGMAERASAGVARSSAESIGKKVGASSTSSVPMRESPASFFSRCTSIGPTSGFSSADANTRRALVPRRGSLRERRS